METKGDRRRVGKERKRQYMKRRGRDRQGKREGTVRDSEKVREK